MTYEDEGTTVALQMYSPLLIAGTKLEIVTLLRNTPLVIAYMLDIVIVEELLSCLPFESNHVVAIVSPLFTVGGRLMVQSSVTMSSLI